MSHSFIAYIDESGDDGLSKFRGIGKGGSTNWLVPGCCLVRATNDLEMVSWRDKITDQLPVKDKRNLHFAKLTHQQKVMVCKNIADLPIRVVIVMVNKKLLPKDLFKEKNALYWHAATYLIESISALCGDLRVKVPEGDGRVSTIVI